MSGCGTSSVSPSSSASNYEVSACAVPYPFYSEEHARTFSPEMYSALLMRYYDVLQSGLRSSSEVESDKSVSVSSASVGRWHGSNRRKKARAAAKRRSSSSVDSPSTVGDSSVSFSRSGPDPLPEVDGYCYLSMVDEKYRAQARLECEAGPTFERLMTLPVEWYASRAILSKWSVTRVAEGKYHLVHSGPTLLATLRALAELVPTNTLPGYVLQSSLQRGLVGKISVSSRLGFSIAAIRGLLPRFGRCYDIPDDVYVVPSMSQQDDTVTALGSVGWLALSDGTTLPVTGLLTQPAVAGKVSVARALPRGKVVQLMLFQPGCHGVLAWYDRYGLRHRICDLPTSLVSWGDVSLQFELSQTVSSAAFACVDLSLSDLGDDELPYWLHRE